MTPVARWMATYVGVALVAFLLLIVWIDRTPLQSHEYFGPIMSGTYAAIAWVAAWRAPRERRRSMRWLAGLFTISAIVLLVQAIVLFH